MSASPINFTKSAVNKLTEGKKRNGPKLNLKGSSSSTSLVWFIILQKKAPTVQSGRLLFPISAEGLVSLFQPFSLPLDKLGLR